MTVEYLENLVTPVKQAKPDSLEGSTFTYLDISSIDNDTKKIVAPQRLRSEMAPSRARQLIWQDDILVSTVRPNLNAVAIVPAEHSGQVASTGFCVLRAKKERLWPQYLFYFTQSTNFVGRLTGIANGASYPAVTDGDVLETSIPLPALPDQKKIAAQLERADRLCNVRKFALELSANLFPAEFRQMFGDPVANDRGWDFSTFEEVAPSRLGKMLDASKQTGKHARPYLRNENVQWDHFNLTDVSSMDFAPDDREEFRLTPGDLLICEGGEPGRCAIWRGQLQECYFQKALHRARPDLSKVTPEYLLHMLWALSRGEGFTDHVTSATIAHLTGEKLKAMPIPVPPLALQQEFAALVHKVEGIRAVQREALRQAKHLFASLLHRAFTG